MRKATLMVSLLPSLAYCPLHYTALPSWHTARDKAYNVLVRHLSASLCVESHGFLWVSIVVNHSGYSSVILVTCIYHIHFRLCSIILLQHIYVACLCLGPHLYSVSLWLPHDSPRITCYCLSGAI